MTFAERCFWNMVKTDKLGGLHFRKQQVIHGFIADFYCEATDLVAGIDGGMHETQKVYDRRRDEIIKAHGIRGIRFSNDEAVNGRDRVLSRLNEFAAITVLRATT
jgi:very-short-patch-repair endonuclease